ncbi:hypothetical protein [Bifidobacterium sp. SO1]|uniref:hypothetical protein n=1 Tax=Bifidobacterium sp. SO1 TaxID=2809029 RepID=UPI001BDC3D55|nr:hypothetical protein [Bifidobacterium sp. SO1]MBT1162970.1 hypothetical protein [Bifidobacterium sp. SO1]
MLWNDPRKLSDQEKTIRARKKAAKFAKDLDGFIDFINSDDILHGYDNLKESWDWPFEECHSLERGSNIAFLPTALRRILEGKPVI